MSRPTFFKTQSELRKWFTKNHKKVSELWIGFYNAKSGKTAATYKQALDEALCFGWIDGTRKNVDTESYTNRFTPRKAKSYWSDVNTKRAKKLIQLGRMHSAGLKAFKARDKRDTKKYSFERAKAEIGGIYAKRFKENKKAWDFFHAQPPYYKKIFSWWVVGAKKEETRLKRLEALLSASAKGKRLDMFNPLGKKSK